MVVQGVAPVEVGPVERAEAPDCSARVCGTADLPLHGSLSAILPARATQERARGSQPVCGAPRARATPVGAVLPGRPVAQPFSGPTDVPEQRGTAGDDARDAAPVGLRQQGQAERNEGHLIPHRPLDVLGYPLLRFRIRRVEPSLAQRLEPRAGGPTGPGVGAVAADRLVAARGPRRPAPPRSCRRRSSRPGRPARGWCGAGSACPSPWRAGRC